MNSAGCRARSIAWRISAMRLVTPVEVSLCTTSTALNACARSATSFSSTTAGSTPLRQAPLTNSTSSERFPAILRHSVAKCRLPRRGARRVIDDHRPGGLENRLQPVEDRPRQARKLGPAVIDGRVIDRPQHPVGDVGGPGNLQEMA